MSELPGTWPDVLVLPESQDFISGETESPCGTRGCLIGWANTAFGLPVRMFYDLNVPTDYAGLNEDGASPAKLTARNYFLRRIVVHVRGSGARSIQDVWGTNDELLRSNRKKGQQALAEAWLAAAEDCGYDVENPITIK